MGSLFDISNIGTAGSAGNIAGDYSQLWHSFVLGSVVKRVDSGGTAEFDYAKAEDVDNNPESVGIISSVNGNSFTVVFSGIVDLGAAYISAKMWGTVPGTTPGIGYPLFLSTTVDGELQATDPYEDGNSISKPFAIVFSDSELLVINTRGLELNIA
jgi:hypothetical protein